MSGKTQQRTTAAWTRRCASRVAALWPSRRGVAIVAVLGVLTVLAMLAMAFAVMMNIEQATGHLAVAKLRAEMLAESGAVHAKCLLWHDMATQPAWDDPSEPWCSAFKADARAAAASTGTTAMADARWINVHDSLGRLVGRYAVMVEDEAGKVNINAASAIGTNGQNQGIGPFELALCTADGGGGLPVTREQALSILNCRYGPDHTPGVRGVDDNFNASEYAADEIDNNANGLVDEPGEGIDEPEEYDPLHPHGDDMAFMSPLDAVDKCMPALRKDVAALRALRSCATVFSRGLDTYWDDSGQAWEPQVNINVGSRNQVNKLIRLANAEAQFEPIAQNLNTLVANVLDYRDENHVLTTAGNEYGVEAICFNEIMANDGSFSREAEGYLPMDYLQWSDKYYPERLGMWYDYGDGLSRGFKMELVVPSGGGAFIEKGVHKMYPCGAMVRLARNMRNPPAEATTRLKKYLRDENLWHDDMWKNAHLKVWVGPNNTDYKWYPIIGNDRDTLHVGMSTPAEAQFLMNLSHSPNDSTNSARIETAWRGGEGGFPSAWCVNPESSDMWIIETKFTADLTPPPNLYYFIYIGEQNFPDTVADYDNNGGPTYGSGPWKGYCRYMDVDGDPTKHSESEMVNLTRKDLEGTTMEMPLNKEKMDLLRFAYKDRAAVHAKNGCLYCTLTTAHKCGYGAGKSMATAFANKSCFDVVYVMRPDIIEIMNISGRPISLANWRVVINTGSYADEVGQIRSANVYSPAKRAFYDDPNPTVPANGYFYLTNHRGIFDMEYGVKKSGVWGDSSDEAYPCYELPDITWGVRYKIKRVTGATVQVESADWRTDQMKYQMVEFHSKRQPSNRNGPTGIRKSTVSSTRDTFTTQGWLEYDGIQQGDDAIMVGIPREGGFLSMTMKDQYGQIAARTVEYGSTTFKEMNYSTEKYDPTHYTWVKSAVPTFGGTARKAKNHSMPTGEIVPPHVKDNRFASIGEIQQVRKSEDWENVGLKRRGTSTTRTLKAVAKYFTVAGVRLDPEEEGAHVSGWTPAFGTVKYAQNNSVIAENVAWTPGMWNGQTLRMTSGQIKGEKFVIDGNTIEGVHVPGYSIPNYRLPSPNKGDTFSVGPGYATALYCTRQNDDVGIWQWKNKGLEKTDYGLYIFGLNDSIMTTEFLEENHNAGIEVAVLNHVTKQYDVLPLQGERRAGRDAPAYEIVSGVSEHQYDKSDGAYVGRIHAAHIASDGGITLRLVARRLGEKHCSGFAWFDYAYLAPGRITGKVNVNTASERVLRSLPGVTPAVARNMALGIDSGGRLRLKPYRNVSDILDVKDLSPDVFTKTVNLVTTRSDQYRIVVRSEAIEDVNRDGVFDPRVDRVEARATRIIIVDRRPRGTGADVPVTPMVIYSE